MSKIFALSIKQPWAALLVAGLKTVEVRRWPTARRGRVLIHAARVSDERPVAWAHVPADLDALARTTGGIIGAANLIDCVTYHSLEAFFAERPLHLNEPEWYEPPRLYGFRFAAAELVPFRRYSGWMRFFPVEWDDAPVASPSASA